MPMLVILGLMPTIREEGRTPLPPVRPLGEIVFAGAYGMCYCRYIEAEHITIADHGFHLINTFYLLPTR